ncbi:MAG TPA: hypothetical protein VFB74_24890 [Kribbellaceae bacterium]|nr:hypothetical protein [Kribbellaceae bacterium]
MEGMTMVKTIQPARAARLPQRPSHSRVLDWLKGLASLIAILAIVGGVPYLLVTLFGAPWPSRVPDRDFLFNQLDSEAVLKIIACVIWLAWLHFVVCLVTEAFAERRGRGLPPQVPLGGGSQTLARRLISGVVLLAGTASVTVPVAQAVSMPGISTQASVGTSVSRGTQSQPGMQVEPASKVIPGVTGVRTNNDDRGQIVKYTEVRPPDGRNYDCLWDIAERYLGDGRRYKEIHELNKGKLQPDGRRLSNPDLIMPGWQVRLPADAKGPGVHTVKVAVGTDKKITIPQKVADKPVAKETAEKKAVARETPEKRTAGKAEDGGRWFEQGREKPSSVDIGDPKNDPEASRERPSKPVAPPADPGDVDGAGGTEQKPPVAAAPEGDGFGPAETGVFGVGATVLAAGLALALKRRRGWSLGPGPDAAERHRRTEVDLRMASDIPTARFVDNALRQLGALLAAQNQPLPGVVAALVSDKALTLVLAPGESGGTPPAPWQLAAGGNRWMLRRAYASMDDVAAPAPYPALVTVGRNADGAIVLIDLDLAHGIASFGGVTDVARDVAVSLAVELGTNLWSQGVHVTMVGFGDDLTDLAPDRMTYRSSIADALEDVRHRADHQARTCEARGIDSVTRARLAYPDPELWGTEVVVLSAPPLPAEAEQLNRLAGDPRRSVGVMVVGDVPVAPWRFVVDESGQAVCRLIGLEVDAHTVTPSQYAELVALFRAAESEARQKARAAEDAPAYQNAVADLSQAAPVEIDLLGPIEVDARGEIDPGRRELATEIAVFLASQDWGVHPNVLAGAIWPRGISPELRDSALVHTRNWLGEEAIRTDENGRWVLNRSLVRVDWDVFRSLLGQAATMDDPRGPLSTALGLVHGPAWSNLPAGRYSWLAASGIERRMAEAIGDTALKLAEASLRYNDGTLARTALHTGLRFNPASEELWRATLRLASHFGGPSDLSTVATQMYAAIRQHGGPRGAEAETDALVDELLPGFRRAVA